jgi:succinate dehydrogenase/fumarate reductase flavoprotein subunit
VRAACAKLITRLPITRGRIWFSIVEIAGFQSLKIPIMKDGKPAANMFAAGEIMAGNVLGKGYAAGIGMTIGSVFGRVAGREAAQNARN